MSAKREGGCAFVVGEHSSHHVVHCDADAEFEYEWKGNELVDWRPLCRAHFEQRKFWILAEGFQVRGIGKGE